MIIALLRMALLVSTAACCVPRGFNSLSEDLQRHVITLDRDRSCSWVVPSVALQLPWTHYVRHYHRLLPEQLHAYVMSHIRVSLAVAGHSFLCWHRH